MPTPSGEWTPADRHAQLQAAAAASIEAYLALSRDQAAAGDTRRAILSIWAADLATLQCLLWDSGLGLAPDPDAQLAAVGQIVVDSVGKYAVEAGPATPRQAVERARTAMMQPFDESVHTSLTERFVPIDHLDAARTSLDAPRREVPLDGRSARQLIEDLRLTATDCTAVASAMESAGFAEDARNQLQMAGLACFEAHLIDVALRVGDSALLSVDLRWQLAQRMLADTSIRASVSDVLLQVVGPEESIALGERFCDFAVTQG
jgi:hypothetical protein